MGKPIPRPYLILGGFVAILIGNAMIESIVGQAIGTIGLIVFLVGIAGTIEQAVKNKMKKK